MTIDAKILSKIQKCLAMAEDGAANPNEAASAMRQAQALMKKYGLEFNQVSGPAIGDKRVDPLGDTRRTWESTLAGTVALSLGVDYYRDHTGEFVYYGPVNRVQLAEYAHESLRRIIIKAQTKYKLEQRKVRSVLSIQQRADDYAEGFARAVRAAVESLGITADEKIAIENWMKNTGLMLVQGKTPRKVNPSAALVSGWSDGKNANLKRPMQGSAGPALLN